MGVETPVTRILIVDDDDYDAEAIRRVLRDVNADATIRRVASAEDALDVFDAYRPHLTIVDWELPGVNGYDLIHTIEYRWPADHGVLVPYSGHLDQVHDRVMIPKPPSRPLVERLMLTEVLTRGPVLAALAALIGTRV